MKYLVFFLVITSAYLSGCSSNYAASAAHNVHNGTVLSGIVHFPVNTSELNTNQRAFLFSRKDSSYSLSIGERLQPDSLKVYCNDHLSEYIDRKRRILTRRGRDICPGFSEVYVRPDTNYVDDAILEIRNRSREYIPDTMLYCYCPQTVVSDSKPAIELSLLSLSRSESEPIQLLISPGKRFFYRVPPDTYKLKELRLKFRGWDYVCSTPPLWTFSVQKDTLNYIDELLFGSTEEKEDVRIVEFIHKELQSPKEPGYKLYSWFFRKKGEVPSDAIYTPILFAK